MASTSLTEQPTTSNTQSLRAPGASSAASAGSTQVQLRGKSFAEQEAALRPPESGPAVQLDGPGNGAANVHQEAARGVAGGGGAMPHLGAIQMAFGRHDVSAVQAHTDGAARSASDAIGANAYASGNHVAFGGAPDLHTAAHEAAHVVQQRAGVSLSGGVGQVGDAYERHADAVADQVVQGKSAESLLDGMAGGGGGGGAGVQMSAKKSHAGTFTDEKYALDGSKAADMVVKFTPGDTVDATKIAMIQTVKSEKGGKRADIDPQARERTTDDGVKVDRLTDANTPVYGSKSLGDKEDLKDTKASNAPKGKTPELNPDKKSNTTYQLGHRTTGKDGAVDVADAGLYDRPTISGGADSLKVFETAAVAIDGEQKGTYYGSIKWGWKTDDKNAASLVDFDIASMGVPTKEFMKAAEKFNGAKVRGTVVPLAGGESVMDLGGAETFKLAADDEMSQERTVNLKKQNALFVKFTAGTNAGKSGYVFVTDVKDKGDGKDVKKVPTVPVHVLTADTDFLPESPEKGLLRRGLDAAKGLLKSGYNMVKGMLGGAPKEKEEAAPQLASGTRVKILKGGGTHRQVEVVDGPQTGAKGWVVATDLKKE